MRSRGVGCRVVAKIRGDFVLNPLEFCIVSVEVIYRFRGIFFVVLSEGCFVPVEEALDAFVDFYLMMPTEGVELADINELAHCAVRFA